MSWIGSLVSLLGRVLLSLIFLFSAIGKVFDFSGTTKYMTAHGVPTPALFLIVAILLELAGGLSLLVGYWARLGVVLLLLFLLPVTLVMHDFWTIEDAAQWRIGMIMFMKNLGIAGGLLYVLRFGAEWPSFDAAARPPVPKGS